MTSNISIIPDGFSRYDEFLMSEYNKIPSQKAPENLFLNISPHDQKNRFNFELTVAELGLYERLDELGIKYAIIKSSWYAKNDLFMLGREWELKTIKRKTNTSIKNVLWKITDQGKRNAILDVTFLNRKLGWIFERIKNHLAIKRYGEYDLEGNVLTNDDLLDAILVVRGKKLIRYK